MTSADKITYNRAKTSVQLKRFGSLKQICAILKTNRHKDKAVAIIWRIEASKDRSIEINERPIFQHKKSDLTGPFDSQFQDSAF